MGFTLSLEVDSGEECPYWFTKTDSKSFCHHLLECYIWRNDGPDSIGKLAQRLNLDLESLQKVAGEEYSLEEYISWARDDEEKQRAEEEWYKDMERNKAAWQPPEGLAVCLSNFIQALDGQPNVFTELEITDTYFVDGYLRQDLADLLKMAQWAKQTGEKRVRLVWLM